MLKKIYNFLIKKVHHQNRMIRKRWKILSKMVTIYFINSVDKFKESEKIMSK